MEAQGMWMVIVTYPEWLNWIAWGSLRLNTRIGHVAGPNDFSGFSQLLLRCPDLRVEDEQAFILARLKPHFRSLLEDVPGSTVPEVSALSLRAVSDFIPVTERAARLLEADAQRARVRLSTPIFESVWTKWAERRREDDAHRRGQTLASALGIPEVDIDQIPQLIWPYIKGGVPAPNADRLARLTGSRAYGWGATFALLGLLVGEEQKRDLIRDFSLTALVEARRHDYSITTPILDDSTATADAERLEEHLLVHAGIDMPVRLLVAFWHYEQLLKSGKDIVLESLVWDMAAIALSEQPWAAPNAAYLIGRLMDDAAVTSLLYASKPSEWPTIALGVVTSESLDVGSATLRLKRRMEGRRVGVMLNLGEAREVPVPKGRGSADLAAQTPPLSVDTSSASGADIPETALAVKAGKLAVAATSRGYAPPNMADTSSPVAASNMSQSIPHPTDGKEQPDTIKVYGPPADATSKGNGVSQAQPTDSALRDSKAESVDEVCGVAPDYGIKFMFKGNSYSVSGSKAAPLLVECPGNSNPTPLREAKRGLWDKARKALPDSPRTAMQDLESVAKRVRDQFGLNWTHTARLPS